MSIFPKVKKYLLILSIFFSILIITHLSYVYLYEGSSVYPSEGGTISVGFIGDMPNLNPLEFSQNPSNDYMLQFLYKSLLRYDTKTKRMEGNLANCDLGKDFSKIKCYIKSDLIWSDGTKVSKDDVLATYKAIKDTNINVSMKQMLENVDIADKGDYIEFTSKNADVLLLDSFAMPIVNKNQIATLLEGKNITSLITSGPYEFGSKEFDSKLNIKKITINRKENIGTKDVYIFKYVFKFFSDENALIKNEDTLNIVFNAAGSKNLILSPRFADYKYILPQYVGLFLNTEKISDNDLRKFILFQLENTNFSDLYDSKDGKLVLNPFFTKDKIVPQLNNKNLGDILNKLGYFKKDDLIAMTNKKYDEQLVPEKTNTGVPLSTYFTSPSRNKISFISDEEVLLSGNVPAGTETVYINEYKLNSFVTGNTKFYFRAKKSFQTLKEGANYYSLYTQIGDKKIKRETITIYYYPNKEDLDKKKTEVIAGLSKTKDKTKEEKDRILSLKQNEIDRINVLENIYYYDKNFVKFNLTLEYLNAGPLFVSLAEKIQKELKISGIDITLKQADQKEIENIVKKGNKNYDMILNGVQHGLFYYNIAPFFYSGQAKEGFNFSKLKNISLDLLLEKLKSSSLSEEKLNSIKNESLDVLKKEAVVKTFYSPYSTFFIDKSLRNVENVEMLPYSYYTYNIIEHSYIKENYIIDFSKKSIFGFINWIKEKI